MVSHTKLAIAIALICCVAYVHSGPVLGGVEDEKPVDDDVRKILASVKEHIESKFPAGFTKLEPLSYRTQVVAGKNYFIKTAITDKNGKVSHAHLRIYHPFKGNNQLLAVKPVADEKSPLVYFQ